MSFFKKMQYESNPFLWTCPFPFVYITISFIGGIVTAYYANGLSWGVVQVVFLVLVLVYIGLGRWCGMFDFLGLLGLLCVFLAGQLAFINKVPTGWKNHLIHNRPKAIVAYKGVIIDAQQGKHQVSQATVRIGCVRKGAGWQVSCGKVRLQWLKDERLRLGYGDEVLIYGGPKEVETWLSEEMFDYRSFLAREDIYHTHFIQSRDIVVLGSFTPNSLRSWALKTQRYLGDILKKSIANSACQSVVLALVLGMRRELDARVEKSYIGAGVIHVLAVSGLHVGLLYMLILFLLGLLGLRKRLVAKILSICMLWAYAFITGLSPSVVRSVSMFSLFSISGLLGRRHYAVNTLAIAAFFSMVYNPLTIFHIGFQLSYTAVLGILWLQPFLSQCFTSTSFWLQRVWEFITVSLSAQLATIPLVLYYFHSLPVYSLLGNALMIPAIPIIVILSLFTIITSFEPTINLVFSKLLTHLVSLLNAYTMGISKLPGSKIVAAYPSLYTTFALYGILITLWAFFYYRRFVYLALSTFLALTIGLPAIYVCVKPHRQCIFYDYDKVRGVAFIQNKKAIFVTSRQKLPRVYHSMILPDLQKKGVKYVTRYFIQYTSRKGLSLVPY